MAPKQMAYDLSVGRLTRIMFQMICLSDFSVSMFSFTAFNISSYIPALHDLAINCLQYLSLFGLCL